MRMRSPSPLSKPTKRAEPAPAPPTPTKLTKRMLGRSRTESAIDSQPATAAMAARTISLPAFSSSSSQPTPSEDQEQLPERRLALTATASAPRVKRTYAGQSRSFLISLPVGDFNPDAIQGVDSQEDEFFEQESYSSLRLRWGVDTEDDPVLPPLSPSRSKSNSNNGTPSRKGKGKAPAVYLPPNMMNPLKSITELRSKGESRRFLDEVGYLFEGMDPSNSTGLKRSSASEITTKLCDEEFARKAKAADFYQKTWDVFLKTGAGRDEDKILDILLVFLVALIARNLDTLVELARQEITTEAEGSSNGKGKTKEDNPDTLVGILFFILRTSADVDPLAMASPSRPSTDFEFKQVELTKKDRIMLSNLYTTISIKSRLFPPDTPVSIALLTTHILRNLPSSLLPLKHTSDLLYSLRSSLNASSSPDNLSCGSHEDEDDKIEPQYECIRNHLHLLDMCLLGQWQHSSNDDDSGDKARRQTLKEIKAAKDNWLADGLVAVAVHAEKKLREEGDVDAVSECLEILLRVLVNLTHDDESWARKVISNDLAVMPIIRLLLASVEDGDDEAAKAKKRSSSSRIQDRLCLCLGLLTNLVQSVPEFKDTLRRTKISPTCITCTGECTCPGSLNGLQILVRIYENHTPASYSTATTKTEPNIKQEPEVIPSPSPTSHLQTLSIAEAADASLIQGTLAILFGLLMADSLENQEVILSSMTLDGHRDSSGSGSGGGERLKLTKLVDQAREFVVVYEAMNSKSAGGGGSEGGGKGEGREGEGNASASEVVRVLERLRDEC
ncbi:hypothetical protein P691DRAFT_692580 [Macrolepiota fuliginosa MF-IS2]|uniref:Wings apart-like protein C-terminal domain-containing protein n=1 Tax=Macrolepiota fuliginosa MF-IS2 TaxID=1400762 RepID=A0A9P6C753_9AGAR|nr:hypothetical protein P691DRAFT_692580 [Macrolepiota fuliginosa MF-IS2]